MSWQPAIDPKPADTFACDAIEMVIVPRTRDLGADWKMARFEAIPGDTEFIPLPSLRPDWSLQNATDHE
jgi:hypothetical protein